MTKNEISAGVMPFMVRDGEIEVLTVNARTGDWEFPKGGVENGEELQQTATRELAEETNISDVRLVDSFSTSYSYSFYWEGKPVDKTVHLYLGEVFLPESVSLSEEHSEYKWLSVDETLNQLTHDGMKNALRNGISHLENNSKHPFE